MKEYYNSDEYKSYDEFKELKAEQYYVSKENLSLNNEFYNNKNEEGTSSQPDKPVSDNTVKNKKEVEKENLEQLQKQQQQIAKVESANATTQVVAESASTVAGTVAATVAGAAGIATIAVGALTSSAKMTIVKLEAGADYVNFIVDVSNLDENIEYQLLINNAYTTHEIVVSDNGEMSNLITGLRPYSHYEIALVSYDNEFGIHRYSTGEFTTLKADSPTAGINYNVFVDSETNEINVKYSTYISDLNENGSDFYVEALIGGEVVHHNDLVEESYISGLFTTKNNVEIEMNAYAMVYDELEKIGTATINIDIKGEWGEPTYTFNEENKSFIATRQNLTFPDLFEKEEKIAEVIEVKPTCTTEGKITYKASFDNKVFKDQMKEVIIPPLGHAYEFNSFIFSEDGKTAQAKYVCKNDNEHVELYDAEVTSEVLTPATCEEKGTTRYTATYDGHTEYKDVVDIEAAGHNYEFDSFVFSEDGKTAQAKYICKNDPEHVELYDAEVTSEILTPATCEEKGTTRYTATYDGHTEYKDVVDIEATGHDYQFDSFVWSEDNKTAVAKYVCEHDNDHVETHEATMTTEIITSAGYETEGLTRYVATYDDHTEYKDVITEPLGEGFVFDSFLFGEDGKTAQIRYVKGNEEKFFDAEVTSEKISDPTCEEYGVTRYTATYDTHSDYVELHDIESLGHDYVFDSIIFLEDGTKAQAKYVCSRDPEHEIYYDAEVTSEVKKPATCEEGGITTYTATYDGHTATKDVDDIEPLGHDYQFDSFVWSEDGKTAQAKYVCSHDSEHVELYDAEVTSEVKVEATCEEGGTTTYTATYDGHTDTKDVDDIEPIGHNWDTPTYTWNDDNTKVTAESICKNDSEHITKEEVTPTFEDVDIPSGTNPGIRRFTATFENELFTTQTKDIDIYNIEFFNIESADVSYVDSNSTITLKLNSYAEKISYTVTALDSSDNVLASKKFESESLTLEPIELSPENIRIKLKIEYLENSFESTTSLIELMGITYEFGDITYDTTLNKYVVPFNVTSSTATITETNVEFVSGENVEVGTIDANKAVILTPPGTTFKTKLIINYTNATSSGSLNILSDDYEITYGVELASITYQNESSSQKVLVIKPKTLAPAGYNLKLEINGSTEVSELTFNERGNYGIPDDYVGFDVSSATSGDITYYLKNSTGDVINGGTINLDLASSETVNINSASPNPLSDTAITYLDNGNINLYIPTDTVITGNDNAFVRVRILSTESEYNSETDMYEVVDYVSFYKDTRSGGVVFENIPARSYTLTYYKYVTVDGIDYLTNDAYAVSSTSGDTSVYGTSVSYGGTEIYINGVYSEESISSVTVKFDDDTTAELTSGRYDGSYTYTFDLSEYSGKTPVQATYAYTKKVSAADPCYQYDSWYETHGFTKAGSDTITITKTISV